MQKIIKNFFYNNFKDSPVPLFYELFAVVIYRKICNTFFVIHSIDIY